MKFNKIKIAVIFSVLSAIELSGGNYNLSCGNVPDDAIEELNNLITDEKTAPMEMVFLVWMLVLKKLVIYILVSFL